MGLATPDLIDDLRRIISAHRSRHLRALVFDALSVARGFPELDEDLETIVLDKRRDQYERRRAASVRSSSEPVMAITQPRAAKRSATAAKRLGLTSTFTHLDSTSFHVDGRYNSDKEPADKVVHITKG